MVGDVPIRRVLFLDTDDFYELFTLLTNKYFLTGNIFPASCSLLHALSCIASIVFPSTTPIFIFIRTCCCAVSHLLASRLYPQTEMYFSNVVVGILAAQALSNDRRQSPATAGKYAVRNVPLPFWPISDENQGLGRCCSLARFWCTLDGSD